MLLLLYCPGDETKAYHHWRSVLSRLPERKGETLLYSISLLPISEIPCWLSDCPVRAFGT